MRKIMKKHINRYLALFMSVLMFSMPFFAGCANEEATPSGIETVTGADVTSGGASSEPEKTDTGTPDTGTTDTGTHDTDTPDTYNPDTGTPDTGTPDTGTTDTGTHDTDTPDTDTPDTDTPDTGTPDTGTPDIGGPDEQEEKEMKDIIDAWALSDGGTGMKAASYTGNNNGSIKWGVWLNSDTFGKALDFSTEGSYMTADISELDFSKNFALSVWAKAPQRENLNRVILSHGKSAGERTVSYTDHKTLDSLSSNKWFGGNITLSDALPELKNRSDFDSVSSASQTISAPGDMVFCRLGSWNLSEYADNSALHISIYVSNANAITGGQLELTSSKSADIEETSWNINDFSLKDGWNDVYIGLDCATDYAGGADFSKINYLRIYFHCSDKVTVMFTDLALCSEVKSVSASDTAMLYLDAENNFSPKLAIPGIEGLEGSKTGLADGKWHHLLVTRKDNTVEYYIDGKLDTVCTISASPTYKGEVLCVGNIPDGTLTFDGSLAQLRIYSEYKTPSEVDSTVIAENEYDASTRLKIKHGLVFDRRQYWTPRPGAHEGQTVTKNDIINAMNMGFDHVKLLLTPNHLIDESGSLITENMEYITEVVNYVIELDYVCYICLHPENDFKAVYLGNLDNFELLCKWYGELAEYIGEHWDADHVGIQLMTEPFNNSGKVSWSWMSDRMWGAVRNVLPDHTILTSSDAAGNIERLKLMSPATDTNLIYTFTTYEPYTIGWYWYGTYRTENNFWRYVKDIPYPVEEGVDYTDEIEKAIENVPDSLKSAARNAITLYVRGIQDGDAAHFINNYDSLYNAKWHMLRAESLNDWRQKYGGDIHIMCVEFGCMDALTGVSFFGGAKGSGIPDKDRIQYITDICAAFEAYDIGWSYWSYNEAHTVFTPETHVYGVSPTPEKAFDMFDYDMLEALGVTPKEKP